jgi:hypothetical protein
VEVDTGEPEGRWDQHGRRLAVRTESLPVEEELRVELARPPRREDLVQRRVVDAEQVRKRRLVGGQRDDRAYVEVAVRPAVESAPNSGSEGVVDGRMADGAGNADRAQRSLVVEEALQSDDGVQLQ